MIHENSCKMLFHINWIVSGISEFIYVYIYIKYTHTHTHIDEEIKAMEWNKNLLQTYCMPRAFTLSLTFSVRLD